MANEKRLIDANALLGEIERIYTEHYEKSAYKFIHDFFRAMIRRVRIAPTVDAVEVVHGRWEFSHTTTIEKYAVVKCSNCGHEAFAIANYVKEGRYCPICGAKMDGGDENGC